MVAGLLKVETRVLLCHRRSDRRWYPDVWDFPGGRVEAGESMVDALARELMEELGITIGEVDPAPRVTLSEDDLAFHLYVVRNWDGQPRNGAPEEHDEIRWVDVNDFGTLHLAHSSYPDRIRDLA